MKVLHYLLDDAISALEINSAAVSLAETNNFKNRDTLLFVLLDCNRDCFFTKRLRFRDNVNIISIVNEMFFI
jgi:hypothetical protein